MARRNAPFRGCEATAPLKPFGKGLRVRVLPPFRGCEATAPLKRNPASLEATATPPSVAAKPRPH